MYFRTTFQQIQLPKQLTCTMVLFLSHTLAIETHPFQHSLPRHQACTRSRVLSGCKTRPTARFFFVSRFAPPWSPYRQQRQMRIRQKSLCRSGGCDGVRKFTRSLALTRSIEPRTIACTRLVNLPSFAQLTDPIFYLPTQLANRQTPPMYFHVSKRRSSTYLPSQLPAQPPTMYFHVSKRRSSTYLPRYLPTQPPPMYFQTLVLPSQ